MMIFAAIHNFLRFNSQLQLSMLILTEISYIVFFVLSIKFWQTHKVIHRIWFSILFAVLRIILQILLLLQQSYQIVETST